MNGMFQLEVETNIYVENPKIIYRKKIKVLSPFDKKKAFDDIEDVFHILSSGEFKVYKRKGKT